MAPNKLSWSGIGLLPLLLLGGVGCADLDKLFNKDEGTKEKEPIGCPGESIGSAKNVTQCVCSKGRVLKAGSLECAACDTSVSDGAFCSCTDKNAIFSFDGRMERPLRLASAQVTCVEPTECEFGKTSDDEGECVPCGPTECGDTCGACPVGASCISGICSDAAACVVTQARPGLMDTECSLNVGDIAGYAELTQLLPDTTCSASDLQDPTCVYDGYSVPLSTPGSTTCPGESSWSQSDGVCGCGEGKVLRAGGLECGDCEPGASRKAYCDCGTNKVFSFNGLLDIVYDLPSEQVICTAPTTCEDGLREDRLSGECIACAESECGPTCGNCGVGQTCVSGRCVFGSGCRVTGVTQVDPEAAPCHFHEGEMAYVDLIDVLPLGTSCGFDEAGCSYKGVVEGLSK